MFLVELITSSFLNLISKQARLEAAQARASDISRKKKQNFAGFSGANSRKNRSISRDFRGKKVKIREKSADFRYFCRKKVKIRRKIGRFRGIFAEKCQISKDFQRQILRKIRRFHGKFRRETKTNTADFAGFLVGNFAKIDQFCVDMTSVG